MNDPIKEPIFNGKAPLKYVDDPWIRGFGSLGAIHHGDDSSKIPFKGIYI